MSYQEVEGDLIALAKQGEFDVIAHGCNCFCRMKRGIAPQMAAAFHCDQFPLEEKMYEGHINKLGQIDYDQIIFNTKTQRVLTGFTEITPKFKIFQVVNCYTQYDWKGESPLDYQALTLCMRKMNHVFKGKKIGLPMIGCGLAGGDWNTVKRIIELELSFDCDVTVVKYKP